MNPRIINAIVSALRFYQEEEMAEKTGQPATAISTEGNDQLSSEELDLLCDELTQNNLTVVPAGTPNEFWMRVVETLKERNAQVKYLAPEKFDDDEHEANFISYCTDADAMAEIAEARINPDSPVEELVETLESCLEAVKYYNEHEGAECTLEQVETLLSKWDGTTKPTPVSPVEEIRFSNEKYLEALRDASAQKALENHNFGDVTITDQDGWTRDGKYWSKRVYGDDEDDNRVAMSFGVEFDPTSAKVVETWAQSISS